MKRLFCVGLLCSLFVVTAFAQKPDMTLRVMAYNILYGAYAREAPYDYDRADAIIDLINSYNPDILLLQECNWWADAGNTRLQYFADALGMPYTAMSTNHGSFKLAILSKYPILSYTYLADDVYFWWNILTAEIQLTPTFTFSAASTHFGWWGAPNYNNNMTEAEQAQSYVTQRAVLLSYLQERVDTDLIIGGDWNHNSTQSPFNQGNLHDRIAALGYGLDTLRRFYPSANPIDNIYLSRSGRFSAAHCARLLDAQGLSDHLPVLAEINVTFNPPPVITQQPASRMVDAGQTAVLTVQGLHQTHYAWYKTDDPATRTPQDDTPVGDNSNTLTLEDFDERHIGYYYCVLTNDRGSVHSDAAMLTFYHSMESHFVEPGQTVSFSAPPVESADYVWYRSADNSTQTPADDVVVGGNTNTLVINNVNLSHEGYYYCVVSMGGMSVTTEIGALNIRRLVANWTFNNHLNEYHSGFRGFRVNPPVYVPGIVGAGALDFSGSVDDCVTVPYQRNLNRENFTFSAWAKVAPGGSGTARILLNNRSTLSEDSSGSLIYVRGNNHWALTLRAANGVENLIQGTPVKEGQWQFIAATFEKTGVAGDTLIGVASFYVDGLLVGRLNAIPYRPNTAPVAMVIGSAWTQAAGFYSPFKGLIDDARHYSYALTPRQAAQLYVDVTGQAMCYYESPFDFNNDCRVDLDDFMEFMSDWLYDSTVYPAGN